MYEYLGFIVINYDKTFNFVSLADKFVYTP